MSSLTQKTEVSKFEFNHSEERAREGCIQIFKKNKKQKHKPPNHKVGATCPRLGPFFSVTFISLLAFPPCLLIYVLLIGLSHNRLTDRSKRLL